MPRTCRQSVCKGRNQIVCNQMRICDFVNKKRKYCRLGHKLKMKKNGNCQVVTRKKKNEAIAKQIIGRLAAAKVGPKRRALDVIGRIITKKVMSKRRKAEARILAKKRETNARAVLGRFYNRYGKNQVNDELNQNLEGDNDDHEAQSSSSSRSSTRSPSPPRRSSRSNRFAGKYYTKKKKLLKLRRSKRSNRFSGTYPMSTSTKRRRKRRKNLSSLRRSKRINLSQKRRSKI